MFIETVKRTTKKKTYAYTLLRRSFRDPITKKPKHETLLNLTDWDTEKVEALRALIAGKKLADVPEVATEQGKAIGGLWVFNELAKQEGLDKVLGQDRRGKIALLLVLGRILTQGSRLQLCEWVETQEIEAVLGISEIKKDELYRSLDWLSEMQGKLEEKLYRNRCRKEALYETETRLYLYDVTSSYLEGEENELANYGYNRDRKRGKKQIVVGLLSDAKGRPVSISVFEGNTADMKTLSDQIETVANRFKVTQVIMVGDRGMIKTPQKKALGDVEFHYITAITKKQISTLLQKEVIQLGLFDSELVEVEEEEKRYVLRRNPIRQEEIEGSRQAKLDRLRELAKDANQYLGDHTNAQVKTQVKKMDEKLRDFGVSRFCQVSSDGRHIGIEIDEAAFTQEKQLDGCYVLETDVSSAEMSASDIHDRYKDLAKVEMAFRTMKTGCLEIRPVFVRKESRTRGHVFVTMLGYLLVKTFWDGVKEKTEFTKAHCLSLIQSVHTTIVSLNAQTIKQIPTPRKSVQQILDALSLKLPPALPD